MRRPDLDPRRFGTLCLLLFLGAAGLLAPAGAQDVPDRTLRLEQLVVEPESAGLAESIRDLLQLREGDPVDAATLRAARRRLQLTGWFSEVQVYTERGSAPGQLVLRVDGKLNRRVRFETGFAHDPLRGWSMKIVGLRADHALGTASTTSLAWQLGPRRSMLEADYLGRRMGGTRFDLLVHFEAGNEDWNAYDNDDLFQQKIARAELALGGRWHLARGLSTTLWLGSSAADPGRIVQQSGDPRQPPEDLVGPAQGEERYGNLGLDFTLDRRDLAQPWRRGTWSTLQLRGSRVRDGEAFGRVRGALRAAMPLPVESALAWRLDATWTDPQTPYHLRPIFGGQGTVRGFRDASLSSGQGARSILATGLEWRTPLYLRGGADARLHGVLFADTGTWISADGSSNDWATSVGWGLRMRIPWIQRLSMDVGIPLTPTKTGDVFWVHFGLGFGF